MFRENGHCSVLMTCTNPGGDGEDIDNVQERACWLRLSRHYDALNYLNILKELLLFHSAHTRVSQQLLWIALTIQLSATQTTMLQFCFSNKQTNIPQLWHTTQRKYFHMLERRTNVQRRFFYVKV